MRLAYVYHTDFDPDSAHGNQILHTANALVANGHELTLISAGDPHAYARQNELDIEFDVIKTGSTGEATVTDRLRYYFSALVHARSADVLFTRDISFLRVLGGLPARLYPPTLYEAHKSYSEIGQLSPRTERRRLDAVDGIIAISAGVATDLEALGYTVDSVIPDAASKSMVPETYPQALADELGIDASTPLFVYAGSLSNWKNDLSLVVSGFSSLQASEDAKLLVVGGSDEEVADLESLARDHGVGDAVECVGRVPQRAVFDYLALADIGFVPLREGDRIASHYTSPLKLYEYLISGLEVVASSVPAITQNTNADDHLHLYEPGDQETFVTACRSALTAASGQQSTIDRDKYSYARRADNIDAVLEGLTGSRTGRTTRRS